MDGTVYAIAVVGTTVVVGGEFTAVENSARTVTYKKANLFTYDYATGAVNTAFTATLDGDVLALAAGPNNTVYVGGAFKTVGTTRERGITQLSVATGARPGIGAIDPTTGKALAWNPTRTRGVGVEALVATPTGLLVGSDTTELGHQFHARLGMFPLS